MNAIAIGVLFAVLAKEVKERVSRRGPLVPKTIGIVLNFLAFLRVRILGQLGHWD